MAFIDKINPDVPEGRLLIRNGDYVLKILKRKRLVSHWTRNGRDCSSTLKTKGIAQRKSIG